MGLGNDALKDRLHADFSIHGRRHDAHSLQSIAQDLLGAKTSFEQHIGQFILDWLGENSWIQVQTSGSTGTPKKIRLRKIDMMQSAHATAGFFDLKAGTTALLCLSAQYIAGKMMLVRAMVLGWDIDFVTPQSNPLVHLEKSYDFCAMVPVQLQESISDLHKINKMIVGGGVVSKDIAEAVQRLETKVYVTYGMTETMSHVAVKAIDEKYSDLDNGCYSALPGVSFGIDSRNCLVISVPWLNGNVLVTNDIVTLLTNQKFIWKGRFDNLINSGGIKISPELVEDKLFSIIAERFFVSSIPDSRLGEKVVVFIEKVASASLKAKMQNAIQKLPSLTKYEKPRAIYFVPKFIETPTAKVHRAKTIKLALERE